MCLYFWVPWNEVGSEAATILQVIIVETLDGGQPRNGEVAVGKDLALVAHVDGEGHELLRGQRVPVPDRAAEVLLLVVVVAPLRQPHRGHVLVDLHPLAVQDGQD